MRQRAAIQIQMTQPSSIPQPQLNTVSTQTSRELHDAWKAAYEALDGQKKLIEAQKKLIEEEKELMKAEKNALKNLLDIRDASIKQLEKYLSEKDAEIRKLTPHNDDDENPKTTTETTTST